MRIESGTTVGAARATAPRPAGSAAGAFRLDGAGDASPAAATVSARASTGAMPLLLLQELPDPTEGRRRAVRRGRSLLDQLDAIRMGLLEGRIPEDRLDRLLAMVSAERSRDADAEAGALLDEIELRARVELAKLGRFPA